MDKLKYIVTVFCTAILALNGLVAQDNGQSDQAKQAEEFSEEPLDSSQYLNRRGVVLDGDTLFYLYDRIDGYTPTVRARLASQKIDELIHLHDFESDSLRIEVNEPYYQIFYKGEFVMNISLTDARWFGKSQEQTAREYLNTLTNKCRVVVSGLDIKRLLIQIGLALVVILLSGFIIRYVNRLFKFLALRIQRLKGTYLKGLTFRNYEFITEERLTSIVLLANNILRVLFLIFLFYLTLPIIFSIFPWTEGIANTLFAYILDPLKHFVTAIIRYIPNLFTIAIIVFVVRYITRGIKFLAREVEEGKLTLNNFYPDWAIPTARVINFLLYIFMLVLIWPYIPGSDSEIFKGVSVFLGLLISLGSSSAISNIIAGLVITYMRPYKIGDRVKIGENSGDVVEKNLLVTRVRTIKNEMITVPNSTVLNNSSINYSLSGKMEGLIIHSTVTIGYDVPWRKVHEMLIEAASCTPFIEKNPKPFVLQTSLDDFYVSYQVNAYTKEPAKQAMIYSDLHALIQDIFARNDVEIMSPHYRAEREGPSTIPPKNGE
ncbi:MAG TPA: transmembrane ion channel [Cryomorphaceae bacterium]|nr:transmembrane ion channel [Owenweeksia sp.]MBG00601.1 transmembrane ion channel [Owenweeksia sp.]HAD97877.1 transmembrane ion channel [Cryomorphaceae bacterium]HBF21997.1 transmembrane ion channel [Cryomorphaceae bacterium]|tara:strand:+ start:2515 stop:4149 length:1635 start_codon:yes stop_codon:yes gene_type:complete